MTPGYATKEDLYKMKSEITTEQQNARHQQNNNLQKLANAVDSNSSDNKLLKQSQEFMTKEVKEIKQIILDFIEHANKTYTTKVEHNETVKNVQIINKIFWWAFGIVGSVIITAFLKLIIING